jgi:hypothetical protein
MTDIFVCFHDDIKNYQEDVIYLKLNNNFHLKYDYKNIILQSDNLQWTQPYLSEFTGIKIICDDSICNSEWVSILQYDHKLSKKDIDYIKSNDKILIFNPFGKGIESIKNQKYMIGEINFIDWCIDRYNSYFGTSINENDLKDIYFPSCSAVKIKRDKLKKIIDFLYNNNLQELLSIGSNIGGINRWVAHLFERAFAISIMIEILKGEKYEVYEIEHHE